MQPRITFDIQLKMALVQVLPENQNFLETKQFFCRPRATKRGESLSQPFLNSIKYIVRLRQSTATLAKIIQ